MLDPLLRPLLSRLLDPPARLLAGLGVPATALTLLGLGVGLGVIPALATYHYDWALACLLANRLLDGLDGAVARQGSPSDYGAYLDIVADMIFYGAFVFGMVLAQPENARWSALLLFSFLGSSSSFLAFAALAGKYQLKDPAQRGLYFIGGLAGASETLLFFLAFLRFPFIYSTLAIAFSGLCWLTTLWRLLVVPKRLKALQAAK